MGKHILSVVYILALLCAVSCSGGGGETVTIPTEARITDAPSAGNVACLGFWQVMVDREGKVQAVNQRSVELILNVLGFLEPPPMVNLKIKPGTLVVDFDNQYLGVDVVLKHPLSFARFRGFDVRGVVFGPRVTNADGLTILTGPEFFTGATFGYQDGLLGVPDSFANYEGPAGYKYFCDGLGTDDDLAIFMLDIGNLANRGVFSHGNLLTRHYDLEWEDVGLDFMVFNYAVYANYDNPVGGPPFTLDSFPIETANSQEAFCFDATEYSNTLSFDGINGTGHLDLLVEIWDWQDNIEDVVIGVSDEYPFSLDNHLMPMGPGNSPYSHLYGINGYSPAIDKGGDFDLLIIAFDQKTFGESWYQGLLGTGHELYGANIYNCFMHTTFVEASGIFTIPYDDPMDNSTEDLWSVQKYWGEHLAPNADWRQEGTQWACNNPVTGKYEGDMITWLVSPSIQASEKGAIFAEITYKHDTQFDYDYLHIGVDLVGDGEDWWFFTDAALEQVSGNLTGMSAGYPGYLTTDWYFIEELTPGQLFKLGFIFITDALGSNFDGPFIDHVKLTDNFSVQLPPKVGPVTGEDFVTSFGLYAYSVEVIELNDDGVIYDWEIGDDDPPQYDDGAGNGDGTINIYWGNEGSFTVDCRVTDDGGPPMSTCSSQPLTVEVFNAPVNIGPSEDFEGAWPYSGWSFGDHTVVATGQFWGKTNAMGTNCLDADGADDSCYGFNLFQEARWENITVPNSSNAVLKIVHTMWAEGYVTNNNFYDGGMLFIDDVLITDANFLSGVPNEFHHGGESYWVPNTYLPAWPGDATEYAWAAKFPDPDNWLNGFALTFVDISAYADGNPHDFSFIFHSDDFISCEDNQPYYTWLIDEVSIFYD